MKAHNLSAIVRLHISKERPRAQAELDWFRQQPSLSAAIKCAALARDRKGKRFSHQRRLSKQCLIEAHRVLQASEAAIASACDFDELWKLIDNFLEHIKGIGALYVYDTFSESAQS